MADWRDRKVRLAGRGALMGMAGGPVASGAVPVYVSGVLITARAVAGLSGVAVGTPLMLQRVGSSWWAVAAAAAAPSVPPATATPPDGDSGDAAPPPKPVTTTGSLVVAPVATSSYRDGHWRTDIGPSTSADTIQGRYSGSSYGSSSGYAFYGSKPHTLSGATCTKATVKLRRLSSGDYGLRAPTLRLVTQTTRPSGAPTLNESTSGPSLGVQGQVSPSETTFTLPTSWGQALIDGTRGGIGMVISGDTPYIRLAGRGSWSAAWTLTLYWRRS
ncbi:hypothetical protein [Streptomyces sp. NPDC020983]|uniref:hypothetical protein n=1 Tax=Streptomyces sp. NPDC020983 TaxID=3365106 RepID=UPI0037BD24DA